LSRNVRDKHNLQYSSPKIHSLYNPRINNVGNTRKPRSKSVIERETKRALELLRVLGSKQNAKMTKVFPSIVRKKTIIYRFEKSTCWIMLVAKLSISEIKS